MVGKDLSCDIENMSNAIIMNVCGDVSDPRKPYESILDGYHHDSRYWRKVDTTKQRDKLIRDVIIVIVGDSEKLIPIS